VSEDDTALPPVSVTGVGVAALRAIESERSDRLFGDPFAAGLVRAASAGERLRDPALGHRPIAQWVAVRTRFLDDILVDATAQGCRQVAILGAGLDTRAFRMEWPGSTRLWELDLPDVLAFKDRVIAAEGWRPTCERQSLPLDLSEDWGQLLLNAGFDPDAGVAWVAEGLLAYLTPETRDALLHRTAQLSPTGSQMGLTLASPHRLKTWRESHPDGTSNPRDFVALWQSEATDDAEAWLASFGWQAEVFAAVERSESYGRAVEEGTSVGAGPRLVRATRL
jgi:methyltransferase (TIGR00027 family)